MPPIKKPKGVKSLLDTIEIIEPPKDIEELDSGDAFIAGQMNMLMRLKFPIKKKKKVIKEDFI